MFASLLCMTGQAAQVLDAPNQKAVGQATWQPQANVDANLFINVNIPANTANLIFIRELDNDSKQTSTNISINERFQVSLQPNSYTQVFSCAGTNLISAEPTGRKSNDLLKDAKSFKLAANNTYFFFVSVNDVTGEAAIQQITAESGKQNLINKKYQTHQISRVDHNCTVAKPAVSVVTAPPVTNHHTQSVTKLPVVEPTSPRASNQTKRITFEAEFLFDNDRADIKPMYMQKVQKIASIMKQYPTTHAIIEGHTDSNGSVEYNQSLSQQRAQALAKILVQQFGIDSSRLTAIGHGELRPRDTNNTAPGRANNRRVVAKIDENVTITIDSPRVSQR